MAGKKKDELEDIFDEVKKNLKRFSSYTPKDYAEYDGVAHKIAKSLKKKEVKMTQLRRLFESVKEMVSDGDKLNDAKAKLHVELAWATGRNLIPEKFHEIMRYFLEQIESKDDAHSFMKFLEAIVAYHKYEDSKGGG